MGQHRGEQRFEALENATVRSLQAGARESTAILRNLSANGMQIQADDPFTAGEAVHVTLFDRIFLAEVVYCNLVGESYVVGLKLYHSLARAAATHT